MLKLCEQEILDLIDREEIFECVLKDGSCEIKIESYTPTVCTAIHAGTQFRPSLKKLCLLNEQERFFEEDPYTDQFIQAMPITIIAHDSRYEYDLNRPLSGCIYQKAWGKQVWKKPLSTRERDKSIAKHQGFYRIVDALLKKLEQRFGAVLLFDVHSYNYQRINADSPTFNIGTEQIDMDRWQTVVDKAITELSNIDIDNQVVSARCNAVFFGRGYMISHINSRFRNTLVLPLEVKKIFMDELRGEIYPLVMRSLQEQLKNSLITISDTFIRRFVKKNKRVSKLQLAGQLEPAVIQVDRQLFQLAKGLETLHYINPINIAAEKKAFFKANGSYEPRFRYRPLNVDPYLFRKALYAIPVDSIRDPSIQGLYRGVINNLSEKIGLLVQAGHPDFVYESLKYYGEPSYTDEKNAQFLLHAKLPKNINESILNEEQLRQQFVEKAWQWNMPCKVEISSSIVASAMVSNARKAVLIAKGTSMEETQANALIHHELGVHMATTLNAAKQKLKVFSLGLPGNTLTQEGLAILNEYHSGNMTLSRLRNLAMRVIAVKEMLKEGSFRHTFAFLHEEQRLSKEMAFKLSLRVHRGGGFTKDYLYLNGVSRALHLQSHTDISNLYVGKTGFDYLSVINEMIERELIEKPVYVPEALKTPKAASEVLEYLIRSIQFSPYIREHRLIDNVA